MNVVRMNGKLGEGNVHPLFITVTPRQAHVIVFRYSVSSETSSPVGISLSYGDSGLMIK